MSIEQVTSLIVAVTALVTAIGTAISHLQLRRRVNSQTPGGPPSGVSGPPGTH